MTVVTALGWHAGPDADPSSSVWLRSPTKLLWRRSEHRDPPPLGLVTFQQRPRSPLIYSDADIMTLMTAESLCSMLKSELDHRFRFATLGEAATITAWIRRDNDVRLHALGFIQPVEWELHYRLIRQQAA